MIKHRFQTTARFADLDTQRHVTSRTYESFCMEGRFQLLFQHGQLPAELAIDDSRSLSMQSMLDNQIVLKPIMNYIKFFKEQQPGNPVEIHTEAYTLPDGQIGWYHEVLNNDGDVACVGALITSSIQNISGSQALDLLPEEPISISDFHELEKMQKFKIDVQTALPAFNQSCKQVHSPYRFLFSERTPFYDFPVTAVWRIFEEGRWSFGDAMGFTQERILELDTVTFFTSATFQIHEMPAAGQLLQINSWVESIEKIRLHLRQDLVDPGSGKVYISMRDEQLIVSLKKRRPKKAEGAFMEILKPYMEIH